jgi:hypothetical protein
MAGIEAPRIRAMTTTRIANRRTRMSIAKPTIAMKIEPEVTRSELAEGLMTEDKNRISGKPASGSDKSTGPAEGGDHIRKSQEWGGGSKGSKGAVTKADKQNENSSARS